MNISDFLQAVKKYPTKTILDFYFNVENLKQFWDLISWSIDKSLDLIYSNPDLIGHDQQLIDLIDDEEAENKFEELRTVFYNQMFVILYSYMEIFLNDLIVEIHERFLAEATKNTKLPGMISHLKGAKKNIIHSNIRDKLRFIKKFVSWDDERLEHLISRIKKYTALRNAITHKKSIISRYQKEILPESIIDEDNRVIISEEYFLGYAEDIINFCIEINNDVVKENPILSSRSNNN